MLREEDTLGVFENMVLRIISGPQMNEVTGGLRRLLNEEPKTIMADTYKS
jgi:hypothetical protein